MISIIYKKRNFISTRFNIGRCSCYKR